MGLTISQKRGKKPKKDVNYIHNMARYRHPINLTELGIKVAKATQLRQTLFTDGIHGPRWLRWFWNWHPEVSLFCHRNWMRGGLKDYVLECCHVLWEFGNHVCPRLWAKFHMELRWVRCTSGAKWRWLDFSKDYRVDHAFNYNKGVEMAFNSSMCQCGQVPYSKILYFPW
jgi:hypothetical protein